MRTFIFGFVTIVASGCSLLQSEPSDRDFYKVKEGWDYLRLPLVKPIAAITPKTGTWSLHYPNDVKEKIPILYSGGSVEKLNAKNQFIYGYGPSHTLIGSAGTRQLVLQYFILSPGRDFYFFTNVEKEYVEKLLDEQLDPDSIYYVDELYEEFYRTGKLPWAR